MKNLLLILFVAISISMSLSTSAQVLRPGDGIRIRFLDVKDSISGDYYIQPDGVVQMPFIGIINTAGRDYNDVKEQIIFRYDSLYRNPHLTVYSLIRVNVLGEVTNPGFYYITEIETFMSILGMAGGTTNNADLESIYLVRDNQRINLDVETILAEGSTATDFGLQSGDQIYVPRTWWADAKGFTIILSAIAIVATTLAIILR
jgi:polysaccharide export outer membrane protein